MNHHRLLWRRGRPACDTRFHLPERTDIDWQRVIGAVLLGMGWGLVGYCPRPAVTAVVIAPGEGVVFVAVMVAGLLLQRQLVKS